MQLDVIKSCEEPWVCPLGSVIPQEIQNDFLKHARETKDWRLVYGFLYGPAMLDVYGYQRCNALEQRINRYER